MLEIVLHRWERIVLMKSFSNEKLCETTEIYVDFWTQNVLLWKVANTFEFRKVEFQIQNFLVFIYDSNKSANLISFKHNTPKNQIFSLNLWFNKFSVRFTTTYFLQFTSRLPNLATLYTRKINFAKKNKLKFIKKRSKDEESEQQQSARKETDIKKSDPQ